MDHKEHPAWILPAAGFFSSNKKEQLKTNQFLFQYLVKWNREDVLLSSMVLKHCLPYLITNWGSQMTHFKKSLTSNKTYMISHQQTQPHCCRAIASLRDLTRTCLKPEHPVCWERYLTVLKCPPLVCRPGPWSEFRASPCTRWPLSPLRRACHSETLWPWLTAVKWKRR